jgi:hypothetical protein
MTHACKMCFSKSWNAKFMSPKLGKLYLDVFGVLVWLPAKSLCIAGFAIFGIAGIAALLSARM